MALVHYTLGDFPGLFKDKPPMIIPLPYKYCMSPFGLQKYGFHVNLDVQHFKPEEVTVKYVGNSIIVECKHDENQDEHGYITRRLVRRYVLPDDIDVTHVRVKLSSDGILSLVAPKVVVGPKGIERTIPINLTHAPAVVDQQGGNKKSCTKPIL